MAQEAASKRDVAAQKSYMKGKSLKAGNTQHSARPPSTTRLVSQRVIARLRIVFNESIDSTHNKRYKSHNFRNRADRPSDSNNSARTARHCSLSPSIQGVDSIHLRRARRLYRRFRGP